MGSGTGALATHNHCWARVLAVVVTVVSVACLAGAGSAAGAVGDLTYANCFGVEFHKTGQRRAQTVTKTVTHAFSVCNT